MKKIITILILTGIYSGVFAGAGFRTDYFLNHLQVVRFDLGSGNILKIVDDEVNGQPYGEKFPGDTWLLKGGQAYIWADNGTTINSATLYYRVYRDGNAQPDFISIPLSNVSQVNSTLFNYYSLSQTINLLDHSVVDAAGTYYVEFYYKTVTSDAGTIYFYDAGTPAQASFTTNSALPVELTTFTAFAEENKVALAWETATEVNNYGFEIERKVLNQVQNDKVGKNWIC